LRSLAHAKVDTECGDFSVEWYLQIPFSGIQRQIEIGALVKNAESSAFAERI
jgi:hypothetical protein